MCQKLPPIGTQKWAILSIIQKGLRLFFFFELVLAHQVDFD